MGAFSDEMDRIINIEKQESYEQGIIYGARKVLKLFNIDANISEDIMHYVLNDEPMEEEHSKIRRRGFI